MTALLVPTSLIFYSDFVPTMQRATPGVRTLPSFSYALTLAMTVAAIRSRVASSTCSNGAPPQPDEA